MSNETESSPPILEKQGVLRLQDETGEVKARKCKCGLVWCEQCSKGKWTKKHSEELARFDRKRTRLVTVGVSRESLEDGEAAWRYITEHRLIPQFIRNLERGKKKKEGKRWVQEFNPIKINKWKSFLEWHKDGFPHYHIFIEVEKEGAAGRIGNNRIRHYWRLGIWVHEEHFETEAHWRNQVGYFQKNGYFNKGKKHQTRLPEWALNRPGLKIKRSSGSIKNKRSTFESVCDYFKRKRHEVVDTRTGEILNFKGYMEGTEKKTYGERLKECGQKTWMRIKTVRGTIQGIFDIPYKEIRKNYEGEYCERVGYIFKATKGAIDRFITKCVKVEEYERKRGVYWQQERRGLIKWKWCLKLEPLVVNRG